MVIILMVRPASVRFVRLNVMIASIVSRARTALTDILRRRLPLTGREDFNVCPVLEIARLA